MALVAVGATLCAAAPADPNLYLEDVTGLKALAQVKAWNAATLATLEKRPDFETYRIRALKLLSDDHKIAGPDTVLGQQVFNLWQDDAHSRGLWRVSPLTDYAAGRPQWRTLIDVDALSRAQVVPLAFRGAVCRPPAFQDCMVSLSNGGADAVTVREFDVASARFVAEGFSLPAGVNQVDWAGADALYVGADFGPGTLTTSGFPRIIKRWRRGEPLAQATTIFEGEPSDAQVNVSVGFSDGQSWPMAFRQPDQNHFILDHIAPNGRLVRSPLPERIMPVDVVGGYQVAELLAPWEGRPAGALVAYSIPDLLAGRAPVIETVFTPTARQAYQSGQSSRTQLWVSLLDDVSGRLMSFQREADGRWVGRSTKLPDTSTIHLQATAPYSDMAFATVEGMLTPPTLYRVTPDAVPVAIAALPAQFDASTMVVTQRFATSKDGTRVPYFLVRRKDVKGSSPALLHALGGFGTSYTPGYLVDQPYRAGPTALFWVEEGNAYVLADLRGGGEYGPHWHEAAMREKRQNAFDDAAAVAQDLITTGVSQKGRIAISGRSNGGLMAAVEMIQHPKLYGAVVIGSPLIDMKRFNHMLEGALWTGEYGDPDKPADWAYLSKYSPYQTLEPGVKYPTPFIYTSTTDDRVSPAHARKFAAKLEKYGNPFFYFESAEGGHVAGVEASEDALRAALITSYLNMELRSAR